MAQQKQFRIPPTTPVTCSNPERNKILQAARVHFCATTDDNKRNYPAWKLALVKYNTFSNSWLEGCWRVCKTMDLVRPTGYDWKYLGQYGRKEKHSSCSHAWTRLVRRDNDRISVTFTSTNTLDPDTASMGSKYPLAPMTIQCSSRDYFNEKTGWSPIKPYTRLDDAYDKFC